MNAVTSKSGQQKLYGILLIALLVVLIALNRLFPGDSVQEENSLRPIRAYISNSSNVPIEVYSGFITKMSQSGLTLVNGNLSKEFSIHPEHPARYLGINGQPTEPIIGDKVHLFFVGNPNNQSVTRVDINISARSKK